MGIKERAQLYAICPAAEEQVIERKTHFALRSSEASSYSEKNVRSQLP